MIAVRIGIAALLPSILASQRPPPRPAEPPRSELEKAAAEFRLQTQSLGMRPDSPAAPTNRPGPKWHGRLYENLRNDFLDAVPHEIAQRGGSKSLLRRNQFGFNLAGPVIIPRLYAARGTFFSVSYEGVREKISRTSLTSIPILPERQGDFSQTVDSAGAPLPVFDPLTTRRNPGFDPLAPVTAGNLEYSRSEFPGGRIPASRQDSKALEAVRLYPAPNASAGPFFRNNYFVVSTETNTADGMISKVDHTLNERHRVAAGFNFSNGFAGAAHVFQNEADPGASDRQFSSRRGSAEHTFTATANTVNTFTAEASTDSSGNPDIPLFPNYRFSPYRSMGHPFPVTRNVRNNFIFTNGFSTHRGKHAIRLTGQFIRYQVNSLASQYPVGGFRFGPGLTSLPGIVNTGHAFASFMLGLAEYAEASIADSPSYFRKSYFYTSIRDQWEIHKGLTISASLSPHGDTPRTEKYDRQATVDLSAINPVNGRKGAIVAANRNGAPRAFRNNEAHIDVSASVAWNPASLAKTVIRAGYGRSYSFIPVYSNQWATQGFTGSPTYLSPNIQLEPAVRLSEGLPPARFPDLRPESANDTVADLADRSRRVPTYQSASLSIERELPGGLVATAGFAYSGGKNLLISNASVDPNAIPASALAYRDQLNDEAFNKVLRPYPQYKGFDLYYSWPAGKYQRDAGSLRIEKRSSKGVALSAYYEFAKQLDDYSGPYGVQDFFHRRNEWAITAGSVPQRLSLNFVYELPFGDHKPFFGFNDWRRHAVDGWSISGITSVTSGDPLYLRPMFNNTGGVLSTLNVNVVPGVDGHVPHPGPDLWYNPAAFVQPPDFTIGNASRTSPTLRNPGNQNHDLSLTKRFAIDAERTMEFTAAGFNFINHANWNNPDNAIGPASAPNVNAGKIIGSTGGRVVQFGLRLSF